MSQSLLTDNWALLYKIVLNWILHQTDAESIESSKSQVFHKNLRSEGVLSWQLGFLTKSSTKPNPSSDRRKKHRSVIMLCNSPKVWCCPKSQVQNSKEFKIRGGAIMANWYHSYTRSEWLSGLNSSRQVTEVKLGRVRSNSRWVTSEAWLHNSPRRPSEGTLN